MPLQEQVESLDFVLSEACSRQGGQKPQLVLAGATLPSEAQLQSYTHKVLCLACPPTLVQGSARRPATATSMSTLHLACHMWVSTFAEHALLQEEATAGAPDRTLPGSSMHSNFSGLQESFGSCVILLIATCNTQTRSTVRALQGFVRDAIALRVGRLGKVPAGLQHRCVGCSCSIHGA